MKVKLSTDWTYYRYGEVIDVTETLANRLVDAKKAVHVDGDERVKAKAAPKRDKMVAAPMEMK